MKDAFKLIKGSKFKDHKIVKKLCYNIFKDLKFKDCKKTLFISVYDITKGKIVYINNL